MAPYVSLWSFAATKGGTLWVISGDLPTEYLADPRVADARSAMKAIAARWVEVSAYMLRGQHHPTIVIGRDTETLKELGDLLQRRSALLRDFAADDQKWEAGL